MDTSPKSFFWISLVIVFKSVLFSCTNGDATSQKQLNDDPLFVLLDSTITKVSFQNTIYNDRDFNIFSYRNFYNGGGVGLGDLNNDGLVDIYLTSNLGRNKLYLNTGNFTFKDISESSGTRGQRSWSTGVTMVDINSDGLLDIYVCNSGNIKGDDQKNELFINNGDLTFTESAEIYNLADSGFTTHVAFFDYDLDGDLDAYILNNSFIPANTLNYSNKRDLRAENWNLPEVYRGGGDKLLKNVNGRFEDASQEAGIYGSLIGFGLGVTVGDINGDYYPDIYVSNDFFERDYLYINNQNGTFTEDLENYVSHLSLFSMGADMADINNDNKPDIFVTDMLPEGDERLKNTTNFDSYDVFNRKYNLGFYNQFMQNTLQINTGNQSFFEIAHYANVSKTDWSWGALLFDMDNDGFKDIYVCNGIYHDLTNQDFIDFFANDIIRKMVLTGNKEEVEDIIDKMPKKPIPNYAFKNNGDLTFEKVSKAWGMDIPSFSNGAAYGDLDNDGDLDLVINNVNQPAFIYENKTDSKFDHTYIKIRLKGEEPNTFGIGSNLEIYTRDKGVVRQEMITAKGFQSSIPHTMTIGLGAKVSIDSLVIVWPDLKRQSITQVPVNTTLTLEQKAATTATSEFHKRQESKPLLKEMVHALKPHEEDTFVDFDYEGLISQMLSREGPAVAIGDVNGDGNEDIYIGSAFGAIGTLYLYEKGKFTPQSQAQFESNTSLEETAAALFDADGDGDLDLLLGYGGNNPNQRLTNRLFLNNGKGTFTQVRNLPATQHNVSTIAPEDFDNDGDIDVVITSRSVPGVYGIDPKHLLLENDGSGNFKDVTERRGYPLQNIGMVTDATWVDLNNDGANELITVSDWGTPKIFKVERNRLQLLQNTTLDSLSGKWNTVRVLDIDNDGDKDIVLGNQGSNLPYRPAPEAPMKLYVGDFDKNGAIEQITTQTISKKDKPIHIKGELTRQLNFLKKENLKFSEYATKSMEDLFDKSILDEITVKSNVICESVLLINEGGEKFRLEQLPQEAQFSSINAILDLDLNADGLPDLLFGGNNYSLKPQFSRLDASFGSVFARHSKGYKWIPFEQSGFFVKGQIQRLATIKDKEGDISIIAILNNEKPRFFRLNEN